MQRYDEDWREVPGYPGYALSNEGRMRSPRGLMTPGRTGNGPQCVRYQIYVRELRTQVSLKIAPLMKMVWGVEFLPGDGWISMIRKEVKAETEALLRGDKPRPVLPQLPRPVAPSKPGPKPARENFCCPFATMHTNVPGLTTWDCAEMDPLTNRDQNGVWFYVPRSAKERRKIRIETARAQRGAARVAA